MLFLKYKGMMKKNSGVVARRVILRMLDVKNGTNLLGLQSL
jgi:hypothetical protein